MADDERLVLAIDLGTSGAKAAIVDLEGAVRSMGYAPIQSLLLPEGGVEQDPEVVWSAVVTACQQAVAGVPSTEGVLSVAVTSQFSSIVPLDEDHQPTMNMVVWMDRRGAPSEFKKQPESRPWVAGPLTLLNYVRIHGIPPLDSGADSLAHMRFIKLARPEAYARTANFLEPMDFITTRLTGRATTNPCSAFLMLLVDNRSPASPRWSKALLKNSGIDPEKLPELLPVDAEIGTLLPEVAQRLGVPATARVFGGVNDTQAGAVGAFALSGDHAGFSLGTTSVLVTHVGWKRTDIKNSLVSMPSPVPGAYLVTAENGIGGRAAEYFLKKIIFANDAYADHTLEDEFAALHRAIAKVPPGSDGVLFLPWLTGSLAPAEDGKVRGGFLNLSLETTREHLGRAVLEGVALNFRWMRRAVEKFCKRELSRLIFYGGGAVSDAWAQIFADVVQLPVHQVENPRYTICRGVALLSFHRLGLVGLDDLERRVPIARIYEPRPDTATIYDPLFFQFVRAFKANRKIFHALNG